MARPLFGFVLLDKPLHCVSTKAGEAVRDRLGGARVGHAGTLDPAATGLLPLGVGSATRLLAAAVRGRKAYTARVQLGAETDSGRPHQRRLRRNSDDHSRNVSSGLLRYRVVAIGCTGS